jgi:hypothetical protein
MDHKRKQFKINFSDLLHNKYWKSKKLKILILFQKYIYKKLSVENIIKKINEIDKLQFVLFNHEELQAFKIIPEPSLNHKGLKQPVYKYYQDYEFYRDITYVKYRKILESMSRENPTKIMQNIKNII